MARSLSNLANNLSQGVHRIKYQRRNDDKKLKLLELNISIVTAFLNK